MSSRDFLIETVANVIGVRIEIWSSALEHAKHGHPEVTLARIRKSLEDPVQVVRSKSSNSVCLFYELEHDGANRIYFCTVVEVTGDGNGKMVTAYESNFIKKGQILHSKG